MHSTTGYSAGAKGSGLSVSGGEGDKDPSGYWSLARCKRAYTTYLDSKRLEIQEQQMYRRYRHGSQWTKEQIDIHNDRRQPIVTYNRIGRKIDGIVGLVEKLRQDPKAYPRTPHHQQGADLATAALRFVTDEEDWKAKTPIVSEIAAIDGIGGIELTLHQGDQTRDGANPEQPDMDPGFEPVAIEDFFYDPRSFKHDFSDAMYMGTGKWLDEDQVVDMYPDLAEAILASGSERGNNGSPLSSDSDRDNRWFQDQGEFRQIRVVEIWYKHKGKWCWCQFTGGMKLQEGESPFIDEEGQQFCKYIMFSAAVDHEGDRYGFVRNLLSAQDEINMRGSKSLHLVNSRKIRTTQAAIQNNDVEKLRREAARPDGVVISNTTIDDIQFDDAATQQAIMGQLEMRKLANAEIENFGPNPAVLGDAGVKASSGRAIALMQQSGIAELGPYMTSLRGWKIRVYRALFNIVQMYWRNERWIRVTDDQGLAQFVGINQLQVDPMTQAPTIANQIGELDVDIILDEGPDTITIMQDTYETIAQALPSLAPLLSPELAGAALDILVKTSPLPEEAKKQFREAASKQGQQPSPEQQKMQAELHLKQVDQQMKAQDAQSGLQLKREEAQLDAQVKVFQAEKDMEIDWMKAKNAMRVEQFKAQNQVRLQGQQQQTRGTTRGAG